MKKKKKRERKKERTFFSNRKYIDWKKRRKETEHLWTVIVTLFWLVVKWKKFLSLSLKATLEIFFFFLFILWKLTKTINRGFYTRFTNNCTYIDSKFFLEFGFSWNRKCFFSGFLFWRIGGWRESRTDIHPSEFTDCCWVDGKESNSIEEFAGP